MTQAVMALLAPAVLVSRNCYPQLGLNPILRAEPMGT